MARLSPSSIRALSALHTALYRATRGRLGRRLAHHDILLLTTTGRLSGRPHTVPLLFLRADSGFAVVASFGGSPRHPDWYRNLAADPRAEVRVGGQRLRVVARHALGEERRLLWEQAVAEHPGYSAYQARTDRLIPVALLQPDP